MSEPNHDPLARELTLLVDGFLQRVSFEARGVTPFQDIHGLFLVTGLVIKISGAVPEISRSPSSVG